MRYQTLATGITAGPDSRMSTPVSQTKGSRILAVDVARGLVIAIMALDHARDFFGSPGANPTDLSTTTVGLFLTRWITHICAPSFFLLTGIGARLSLRRMCKRRLSRYLATRGLWLMLLEVVVIRFTLQFNFDYQVTIITVLWALGWAMLALAGLIWLPGWSIVTFAVLFIAGHDALDHVQVSSSGLLQSLWAVLHQPGVVYQGPHSVVFVSYVLIPWTGVTALGYALGEFYQTDPQRRRQLLLYLGLASIGAFVVLRFINLYGDPVPWSAQKNLPWTMLSFLNTSKYPPSLSFLLMTLGPAFLILRACDAGVPKWLSPANYLGRVPLFFYVLHLFLIHIIVVAVSWLRYGHVRQTFRSPDLAQFPFAAPPDWDLGLPFVYAMWAIVLMIMYPLCWQYSQLRLRRPAWWLSYL